MSTTTQIRLPRQFAAPEGPVDMTMMYVMHHAFRRDFEHFAAAVPKTPVSDAAAWRALEQRWSLLAQALHHHHHGEDTWLWPALLEKADPEDRETLLAMEAEHEQIDPILTSCAAGFARLAGHADEDARAALAVRLCAAKESLAQHLRHEETEAIAIVQQVMTQEDWEQLEAEHFRKDVPFSQVLRIVPWAAHDVPGPLRRQVFAQPGGRANELLWRLTRRSFERRERIAFRHVA